MVKAEGNENDDTLGMEFDKNIIDQNLEIESKIRVGSLIDQIKEEHFSIYNEGKLSVRIEDTKEQKSERITI